MRHKFIVFASIGVLTAVLLAVVLPTLAAPSSGSNVPKVTLLDAPRKGEIHLQVGESYTLRWHVESATPFQSVTALADQYYPGRGIFFSGTDRAGAGTSGDVSLSLTGKEPTNTLAEGYAPISPVIAVRFGGGVQPYQLSFNLKVFVTP